MPPGPSEEEDGPIETPLPCRTRGFRVITRGFRDMQG